MAHYIGIDLGTSSVKLVLITEHGTVLFESSREYSFSQPQEGFKEISANIWWNGVDEAMAELLANADRNLIKGIGITGQMHSLVLLDIAGITEGICPEVKGSAEIAGTILPQLAQRYGLSQETVVIVGTGDNPAASIPTGCLGKGHPVLSLGTSAVLMFQR